MSNENIKKEDYYQLLFDRNPLPMWVFDKNNLAFLSVNEAAVRKYGYSEKEFLSMTVKDIRPKEEKEKFIKYYKESNQKDFLTPHGVWKHVKKDGTAISVQITASDISFNGAEATAVVVNDITEQEKAQIALTESEERFRLLADSSLEGIVFSENHLVVDANEQFVKMFGYKNRNEIIGKKIDDMVHPDSRPVVEQKINETNPDPYEVVCYKKDGSPIVVRSKGRIIPYHGRMIRISVLSDITQQKEYEKNLQESEERYRQLFENNLAAVFRSDIKGKLIAYNSALATIFGYTSVNELQKVKAQDLYFSIEDRNKYLLDLKNNGFVKNYQMRMKKKDGSEIWILENVSLFKDTKTNSEYIEGTLIDITETKKIQQKLQESEENYKSLIEHTPDGILIHDEKGEVIYANPAALNLVGLGSLEEAQNTNLFNYVQPEDHEKIKMRKAEMNKNSPTPFLEIKILRKDGKIIEAETKTSRIVYKGKPAVEVVLHDVALQRQLEREQMRYQLEEESNRELKREIAAHIRTRQRLNANQKYIRLLIDSSLDMIFACDHNGKITEFNQAAQNIFGYTPAEVLNKHISVLYADKELSDKIGDYIFEDGNFAGEVMHVKKNGQTFSAYISAALLKNEKGELLGTMSISRDITRIKEAEEQLRKSVHEKEILLKEIHHRVKNNLQVISSILKLQSSYVKDPKIIDLLKECRNRISSMAFIHATLYMTKDFTNINFAEYIANLAGNLQQSYTGSDKKILLRLDIPKLYLHIDDAIPCGLIVNELLSNSFKYAFEKKKSGAIGISVKVKKENIILAIWDDGGGIPKNVDYRNTESLGLQLVISLVEQLRGTIKLERGKGTKYVIEFKKTK